MSRHAAALRLGTRGSDLARRQAHLVQRALADTVGIAAEIVVVRTAGDDLSAGARWRDETPGLFTTEIEQALDRGDVDAAVHSLKDLPTVGWSGTVLAAVLERADPRDALVSVGHAPLEALVAGARVGTSSLRRRAQLLEARPDLTVEDLRGNVPTRLARVAPGDLDAAVLAVAGLERLGRAADISQILPVETYLPAPGQGAIAVQARVADAETIETLRRIAHQPTWWAVSAERALLAQLEVGCHAPVGAYARVDASGDMVLDAFLGTTDGRRTLRQRARAEVSGVADAIELGRQLATDLLERWRS